MQRANKQLIGVSLIVALFGLLLFHLMLSAQGLGALYFFPWSVLCGSLAEGNWRLSSLVGSAEIATGVALYLAAFAQGLTYAAAVVRAFKRARLTRTFVCLAGAHLLACVAGCLMLLSRGT